MAGDIEYTALPQRKRRRGAAAATATAAAATAEGEAAAGAAAESGGEAAPAQAIAEQREEYKFEYLDHTADVQLHSWGATLEEAFEGNGEHLRGARDGRATGLRGGGADWRDLPASPPARMLSRSLPPALAGPAPALAVLAMFNYMTPLDDDVLRNDVHTARTFSVSAHDMHSLLFAFLDETLFVFASEQYVPTNIKVRAGRAAAPAARAPHRARAWC